MIRTGPGTTLHFKATITYLLGTIEMSRKYDVGPIAFDDDTKIPRDLWGNLAGKTPGTHIDWRAPRGFTFAGMHGHEVFRIERPAGLASVQPGATELSVDLGSGPETVTVLEVGEDELIVSPNPLAMTPVARVEIESLTVEGGIIIDGDQIDPSTTIRAKALELDSLPLSRANGNLLIGGAIVVNQSSNGGANQGVWLWNASDTNHVIYSSNPAGTSPAGKPCTRGHFNDGHRFRLRTYTHGQGFLFENSDEQPLVDIEAGGGHLWTRGSIYCGGSDLYFLDTNHNHSGVGNTLGHAAIENGANYEALMILGRTVSTDPLRRVVKVWDEMHVEGDFSARRTLNPSDARDKTGIEDLDRGLAELERLRPVSFQWKEGAHGRTYGLLAQEAREVLPEVVSDGRDDARLQVSYVELVPVLINAIKELSAKVASLEAQLAAR
jgi:hypothetical protein